MIKKIISIVMAMVLISTFSGCGFDVKEIIDGFVEPPKQVTRDDGNQEIDLTQAIDELENSTEKIEKGEIPDTYQIGDTVKVQSPYQIGSTFNYGIFEYTLDEFNVYSNFYETQFSFDYSLERTLAPSYIINKDDGNLIENHVVVEAVMTINCVKGAESLGEIELSGFAFPSKNDILLNPNYTTWDLFLSSENTDYSDDKINKLSINEGETKQIKIGAVIDKDEVDLSELYFSVISALSNKILFELGLPENEIKYDESINLDNLNKLDSKLYPKEMIDALLENNHEEYMKIVETYANEGNAFAQFAMGYYSRIEATKLEWFEKAADNGSSWAFYHLYILESLKELSMQNKDKILEYAEKATEKNNPFGKLSLAREYLLIINTETDLTIEEINELQSEILRLSQEAAFNGATEAYYLLSSIYRNGSGVEVDLQKAAEYVYLSQKIKNKPHANDLINILASDYFVD